MSNNQQKQEIQRRMSNIEFIENTLSQSNLSETVRINLLYNLSREKIMLNELTKQIIALAA